MTSLNLPEYTVHNLTVWDLLLLILPNHNWPLMPCYHCIYWLGCVERQLAAKGWIIVAFTIVALVIESVHPVPTPLPGEYTALLPSWRWDLLKHMQSLPNHRSERVPGRYPFTPGLKEWRCRWCICPTSQGHVSTTLQQPRPVPKTCQSKVAGHSHRTVMPCMYMEYINYNLDVGTLRMVTATVPGSLSPSVVLCVMI